MLCASNKQKQQQQQQQHHTIPLFSRSNCTSTNSTLHHNRIIANSKREKTQSTMDEEILDLTNSNEDEDSVTEQHQAMYDMWLNSIKVWVREKMPTVCITAISEEDDPNHWPLIHCPKVSEIVTAEEFRDVSFFGFGDSHLLSLEEGRLHGSVLGVYKFEVQRLHQLAHKEWKAQMALWALSNQDQNLARAIKNQESPEHWPEVAPSVGNLMKDSPLFRNNSFFGFGNCCLLTLDSDVLDGIRFYQDTHTDYDLFAEWSDILLDWADENDSKALQEHIGKGGLEEDPQHVPRVMPVVRDLMKNIPMWSRNDFFGVGDCQVLWMNGDVFFGNLTGDAIDED